MKKTQKKKKTAPKPKRAAAAKKSAVKKAAVRKARKKSDSRPASKPASRKAASLKVKKKGKASSGKSLKRKVLCEFCGEEIPSERIDILPDTTTCVQCSQTKPYSEAQIIGLNGEDAENRLNVEDFEEADTDFSISYNDQW
jgi:RNA polymerase-binding transcription factor DksA